MRLNVSIVVVVLDVVAPHHGLHTAKLQLAFLQQHHRHGQKRHAEFLLAPESEVQSQPWALHWLECAHLL